jgi:prophage regulatory protein
MEAAKGEQVIRPKELCRLIGLSRQTLWRLSKSGEFPAPRQLSVRSVGWLRSEVDEWLRGRGPSTVPGVKRG